MAPKASQNGPGGEKVLLFLGLEGSWELLGGLGLQDSSRADFWTQLDRTWPKLTPETVIVIVIIAIIIVTRACNVFTSHFKNCSYVEGRSSNTCASLLHIRLSDCFMRCSSSTCASCCTFALANALCGTAQIIVVAKCCYRSASRCQFLWRILTNDVWRNYLQCAFILNEYSCVLYMINAKFMNEKRECI